MTTKMAMARGWVFLAKESPNMEVNGVADNEDDSEGAGGEAGGAAVAVVSQDGVSIEQ